MNFCMFHSQFNFIMYFLFRFVLFAIAIIELWKINTKKEIVRAEAALHRHNNFCWYCGVCARAPHTMNMKSWLVKCFCPEYEIEHNKQWNVFHFLFCSLFLLRTLRLCLFNICFGNVFAGENVVVFATYASAGSPCLAALVWLSCPISYSNNFTVFGATFWRRLPFRRWISYDSYKGVVWVAHQPPITSSKSYSLRREREFIRLRNSLVK